MEKSWKRFLSMLVVVVMVLSMLPANVFASETTTVTDFATLKEKLLAGESVKLGGPITMNEAIVLTKDATLDLAGQTLTLTGSNVGFTVNAGVTFTLKDTEKGGELKGSNNSSAKATGVLVKGTFEMLSGTITNFYGVGGGAVKVDNGGVFNMRGGLITNSTATYGGGVYLDRGTFNMFAGQITGIKSGYGINIYRGKCYIKGGQVTGNSGFDVYLRTGTNNANDYRSVVEISGSSVVASVGRQSADYTHAEVKELAAGANVKSSFELNYAETDATINLQPDGSNYVYTYNAPAHTCADENFDHICDGGCDVPQGEHNPDPTTHLCAYCNQVSDHEYDDNGYCSCGQRDPAGVAEVGGKLYESLSDAITAAKDAGTATVKVLKDTSLAAGTRIEIGQNLTIDLNGRTVSITGGGNVFYVYGTSDASETNRAQFTITDTSEAKNGVIDCSAVTSGDTIVRIDNYGKFTLEAGTLTGKTKGATGAAVRVYRANAEFIMTGGKITQNASTESGGAGAVYVAAGKFTMSGGEISGNTNRTGKYDVEYAGGTIEISGTAVLDAINAPTANITLGELTEGARIVSVKQLTKSNSAEETVVGGKYVYTYKAPHVHEYELVEGSRVEPTCTAKGSYTEKCAICGDEKTVELEPEPDNHDYVKTVIPATCVADGKEVYECACGDKYETTISSTGKHGYTGVVTQAPTCTVPGVMTNTCAGCGDSYNEAIPVIPHSYGDNGFCTCGEPNPAAVAQVGDKLYLSLDAAITAALNEGTATVTVKKDTSMSTGKQVTPGKNLTIDLNGHTVTVTGNSRLFDLTAGSAENRAQLTITDNSAEKDGVLDACNATGFEHFIRIQGYGRFTLAGGKITNVTGTATGAVVRVNQAGAEFIMTDGEISSNTSTGGAVVYAYNGTFEMTGGKIFNNTPKEGNGAVGCYRYGKIKLSGDVYVDTIHAESDFVELGVLTEDAKIVSMGALTYDTDYNISRDENGLYVYEVGTHKHEYTYKTVITDPTCTAMGEKKDLCLCGKAKVVDLEKAPHTPVEGSHDCGVCQNVISDCIDENERDHKCDICLVPMGDEHVAAEGSHNCAYCGKSADAGCSDASDDQDHNCDICGDPCGGHSYGDWVTVEEPTCGATGLKKKVCNCGAEETEVILATGEHNYATEVPGTREGSTCVTHGKVQMACGCGATEWVELPLAADNHADVVTVPGKTPTCTEDGWTESSYCAACNEGIKDSETLSRYGHDYTEVSGTRVDSTCNTKGHYIEKCANCDDERTVELDLDLTNHEGYVEVEGSRVASTCAVKGHYTEKCACGDENEVELDLDPTNHAGYVEVEGSRVASTCTVKGHYTEKCACGDENEVTLELDPDNHVYGDDGYCVNCPAQNPNANFVAEVGGKQYLSLQAAVDAAADRATVTLLGDATGAGVVIKKNVTIDFGGYTYTVVGKKADGLVGSTGYETLGFQIHKGYDVTLKRGTLATATNECKMLVQNYANLTLENITLNGTGSANMKYVLSNNCGNVALNGETNITAPAGAVAFDVCEFQDYNAPSVTVETTGTITGKIEVSGGSLEVNAGTFVSGGDIFYVTSGNLTIDGGDFTAVDNVVYIRGGDVTINDGTLKSTGGDYAAIQGNGYYAGNVTVNGGTIESADVGIYWPQNGALTITGGTITGKTAVYAKSGTITIEGGKLIATGDKVDYNYNGNAGDATGDALVIDSCGGNYETPAVSVTGGTFKSENASAVASYANGNETVIGGFITDGTFKGDVENELCADGLHIADNGDGTSGTEEHVYSDWQTVTEAGCETDGLKKQVCSCGDEITEVIPAIGHNYSSSVTAPTCTAQGFTTHTCGNCGNSYKDSYTGMIDHSYGEGVVTPPTTEADGYTTYICGVCGHEEVEYDEGSKLPTFEIAGANVNLGTELAMKFFVKKVDIQADKDYYIVVRKTFADGTADDVRRYDFSKGEWNGTEYTAYYSVKFDGIMASEMADKLYVQVFYADGTAATPVKEDSIRDYAMRIYDDQDDELKTLLVDMLNYGAAAQEEFNYNTGDLANRYLTSEQQAKATQEVEYADNRVQGTNYVGSNLNLGNKISLNFFFSNITPDMYAIATFTDYAGDEITQRIEGKDFMLIGEASNMYRIAVTELAVADMKQVVTVKVFAGDTEVASASDSMQSYLTRQDAKAPVYVAVLKFATSAYNHFN